MQHKMGIVVPYRNRKENLDAFIPAINRFFSEDALNCDIPFQLLVVEQAAGLPFNRGTIKNIGFQYLAPEVQYVCFHDVDLVPISADYRWPTDPAMLIFHGLKFKPDFIRQLFGGVVLLQTSHFEKVNGYSNDYRVWGFEDVDLRERLLRCGLHPVHREGSYDLLPHTDEGSHPDGTPTNARVISQGQYVERWFDKIGDSWRRKKVTFHWQDQGLSSVRFTEIQSRRPLIGLETFRCVSHVVVAPEYV